MIQNGLMLMSYGGMQGIVTFDAHIAKSFTAMASTRMQASHELHIAAVARRGHIDIVFPSTKEPIALLTKSISQSLDS
jgi:hypothetical protein